MPRIGVKVQRQEDGTFVVTRCMRVENDAAQVTVRGVALADVGAAVGQAQIACEEKINARVARRTARLAAKRAEAGQLTQNGVEVGQSGNNGGNE